jgi:hypothetical protein
VGVAGEDEGWMARWRKVVRLVGCNHIFLLVQNWYWYKLLESIAWVLQVFTSLSGIPAHDQCAQMFATLRPWTSGHAFLHPLFSPFGEPHYRHSQVR